MTQLDQQLEYLASLRRFETIKPGLDTMRALLDALGNPHKQFRSLHVAGTNGKGSTAVLLAAALQHIEPNQNTGLYTSPYVYNFNERIRTNGQPVKDQRLAELIMETQATARQHKLEPTYFEFATALAFLYFAAQRVETAVVEVGMGGLLDATNVITPAVSVITNIGFDHTEWLGKTKLEIARNKAGIIKDNVPLVTAETDPELLTYFQDVCDKHKTSCFSVAEYLTTKVTKHTLDGQSFTTRGVISDTFTTPLLGRHQVTNACTALLALHIFRNTKTRPLSSTDIANTKQALAGVRVPGRLDVVSKEPFILVDGAHNEASVGVLADFLKSYDTPQPDTLVIGLKDDKDISPYVKHIIPHFRRVIVTEANFQPMSAKQLATNLGSRPHIQAIPNIEDALAEARHGLTKGSMLLITGSLYLAGDALRILRPHR